MVAIADAELAELLVLARARWPGIAVDAFAFATWVADRLPAGEAREARAADLYVTCACASGDAAAIAAFEREYGDTITGILRRYRTAERALDDLAQRVRIRLLVADGDRPAIIYQYAGRGDLRSFVRVVASRTALMFLRDESEPPAGGDDLAESVAAESDLELAHLKQTYRAHFRQALELAIGRLEPRQRTLLRYQLCDGLTIDQLATIYRVHRATAARWLAQARVELIRTIHGDLAKRLAVSPRELDEILVLVQSRLDVTVERLLRTRER